MVLSEAEGLLQPEARRVSPPTTPAAPGAAAGPIHGRPARQGSTAGRLEAAWGLPPARERLLRLRGAYIYSLKE